MINFRFDNKGFRLGKVVTQHNHCPDSASVMAYTTRLDDLTYEMKDFISCLQDTGIPPADIIMCFQLKFNSTAPPLCAADISNLSSIHGKGGGADAHNVLQLLMDLKEKDEDWFFRWHVAHRPPFSLQELQRHFCK